MKVFFIILAILTTIGTIILLSMAIAFNNYAIAPTLWTAFVSGIIESVTWHCLAALASSNERNHDEICLLRRQNKQLIAYTEELKGLIIENRKTINALVKSAKQTDKEEGNEVKE